MYRKRIFVASTLAVLVGVCGCDKTPAVKTVAASGTVTRGGQPLADATVNFVPKGQGKGASGKTDATGHFTLQTLVAGTTFQAGAMVGDYFISVTKPSALTSAPDVTKMSQEEGKKRAEQMNEEAIGGYSKEGTLKEKSAPSGELPQKYGDPQNSGLTASVKAGDPNEFKFDLVD
jgi:hypothetical protein